MSLLVSIPTHVSPVIHKPSIPLTYHNINY